MNKVILVGRLTRDPELKFTANKGTAVSRFSLAVTRPFKKDETDFINCIAFGKTGETIAQYLTKGRQVAIEGRLQTGSYENTSGEKRYITDVIVESFDFIGNNKNENITTDGEMTPVDSGDMPF